MPPRRLPSDLPTDRVHAALRRLGFAIAREGKHTIFVREGAILPLPRHATVSRVLLLRELKRVGITPDEFMENY
jgi:hypothetical protein